MVVPRDMEINGDLALTQPFDVVKDGGPLVRAAAAPLSVEASTTPLGKLGPIGRIVRGDFSSRSSMVRAISASKIGRARSRPDPALVALGTYR